MLFLLYLILMTYHGLQIDKQQANTHLYRFTEMTIYGVVFGILIESQKLLLLFRKGVKVNLLIILAIILLVIIFIPNVYWIVWFGLGLPFYMKMFAIVQTHLLLSVLAGILLVRSLIKIRININNTEK